MTTMLETNGETKGFAILFVLKEFIYSQEELIGRVSEIINTPKLFVLFSSAQHCYSVYRKSDIFGHVRS